MIGNGIRVLVAEDEPLLRVALGEMLADNGFVVTGLASNGAEAVTMARASHPDVALLDLRMPIIGGLEATREIKRAMPDVQVLILSAYEDSALQSDPQQAGVYCYMVKGTSPNLVMDMLRMAKAFASGTDGVAVARPGNPGLFDDVTRHGIEAHRREGDDR